MLYQGLNVFSFLQFIIKPVTEQYYMFNTKKQFVRTNHIIISMYNVRDQLCFKVLTIIKKKIFKDYIVEVIELFSLRMPSQRIHCFRYIIRYV
jgi:hypothetical protein